MNIDHRNPRLRQRLTFAAIAAVLGLSVVGLSQCRMGGDDLTGLNLKDTAQQYAGSRKIEICHIPPGNPENPQTITVGASAVDAHLAHGDQLGPCKGGPTCNEKCKLEFEKCIKSGADPDFCKKKLNSCLVDCEPAPPPCTEECDSKLKVCLASAQDKQDEQACRDAHTKCLKLCEEKKEEER